MVNWLFSILLTWSFLSYASANASLKGNHCQDHLLSKAGAVTLQWIGYIHALLNEQILTKEDLKSANVLNPIDKKKIGVSSKHLIHFLQLEEILKTGKVEPEIYKSWVQSVLAQRESDLQNREFVKEESRNTFYEPAFYPVPPNSFQMGPDNNRVDVTLTHEIEVMDTHVTQLQWAKVMGENPSRWKDGPDSIELEIDGKKIRMNPNHPVENITWLSMLVFANKLSEQQGYKPVYDMTDMAFAAGTSAQHGNLSADYNGYSLKINAKNGDYYQAEGYRLPTEAEFELLIQHIPESEMDFLDQIGFFSGSVVVGTQAAKELLPVIINGHPIYDIVGNVEQATFDTQTKLTEKLNPFYNQERNPSRVFRGSGFFSGKSGLNVQSRSFAQENHVWNFRGFRLVRTLK